MLFKGSAVALVTPFNDNGINLNSWEKLINYQMANQTQAIIVGGTTGEGSTLTSQERKTLITEAKRIVQGKVPIIGGVGSNNTVRAVEMAQDINNVGADALLIVTPYYNKCMQDGLIYHYEAIAKAVDIPLILYNVPSRTGVNIEPSTVIKLSENKQIVGIKEANPNLSKMAAYMANINLNQFAVYSGNDDLITPILSYGGQGVISVLANIYPEEVNNICQAFFNNNVLKARILQLKYQKLISLLFQEVNPIPVKGALNYIGFNVGNTRLPLTETKNIEEIKKEILRLHIKKDWY